MSTSSSWMRARISSATSCTRPLSSHGSSPMPVGRHRLRGSAAELRRQVGGAEQPEVREQRRDREVDQAGEALEQADLRERRHRLLRADDRDRDDRHAARASPPRRSRRGRSAAACSGPCRASRSPLRALGEDEHELLLVVQQAVDVGRMGGHAADLRDEHAEERIALEEVLDGEVQRARARVLLLDRLGDHRRRRAAARRRGWRPAARRRSPGRARSPRPRSGTSSGRGSRRACVEQALDPLRAAPVGDGAVRLDRRQVVAQVVAAWAAVGWAAAGGAPARHASTGARLRASSGQSSPQMTSSVSHSSRFQGCSERRRRRCRPRAPPRGSRASRRSGRRSRSRGSARPCRRSSRARRRAGRCGAASARWRRGRRRRAVRGDVDEVAGLVPARDRLDRARVGLGGEHALLGVRLLARRRGPARAAAA